MSYRIGVGSKFHLKVSGADRLLAQEGATWRALGAEELAGVVLEGDARWNSDVALFAFPDHLRLQWWERVANEITAAFFAGVEYEAFIRAILDFSIYKGISLPARSEFRLVLGADRTLPDGLAALINLADTPMILELHATGAPARRMRLLPGEGCRFPSNVTAKLPSDAADADDPLVLLAVSRPEKAFTVALPTQESRLSPGIQVYSALDANESANTRVLLSRGTVTVEELGVQGYLPGAYLPREPWRRPDAQEAAQLWTRKFTGTAESTLILVKVPDELFAPFRAMGAENMRSSEEYAKLRSTEPFKTAVVQVLEFLEVFRQSDEPFEIAWAFSPAGLPAVTMDRNQGKYIGLHFDDWDQLPLSSRGLGQNRIVINLSKEDREFLFVNLPVSDLVRAVKAAGGEIGDHHSEWRPLVKLFFKLYPNYPVTKVRIRPGEGYIGPTENLIHDGTTSGRNFPDVNLQVRAYLWPKEALPGTQPG